MMKVILGNDFFGAHGAPCGDEGAIGAHGAPYGDGVHGFVGCAVRTDTNAGRDDGFVGCAVRTGISTSTRTLFHGLTINNWRSLCPAV